MPVELFVPKFEREERTKRFLALDSISELAPKNDRRRGRFGYRTNTLADMIRSRSEKGDGVCRNLDQVLFASGTAPVDVYYFEETGGYQVSLEVLKPDGKLASNVHFKFDHNNKFVNAKCKNEVGVGEFDWVWPSFSTDVLKMLRDDLQSGRESWAEKLRLEADNYYQKIGESYPDAVREVKKLIDKLDERSNYHGNGELFVFGLPVQGDGSRLNLELQVAMPSLNEEINRIVWHLNSDGERLKQYNDGSRFGAPVSVVVFDDFDITVRGYSSRYRYPIKIGLDRVEGNFSSFMQGGVGGHFALITSLFSDDRDAVLLYTDPVSTYTVFRD